ncbi:MAG: site-2 protease family protein [Oscillospiraceae bacterium]|nr:site-2 protease family protein [Oscillospiraceae bacterium]
MGFLIKVVASVFVFSLVIFIHELGHFIVAKKSGIKVNEFSIGMGPRLISRTKGDTEYSLRALPIGGFVAMEGEDEESDAEGSFSKAPVANRIAVVVAGAVMNIILGFVILVFLTSQQDAITSRTISQFHEGATTQQTGLQVDDEIIAVNGRRCYIANDVIYEFARTQDGTADFTVRRDGKITHLENVEFQTYTDENGYKQMVIDFYVYPTEKTPVTVIREAVHWTMSLARTIFLSLVDMVTGRVAMNQISGPVGIVSVISEAASVGLKPLLNILALITINLGVFNLVPFPALDGGRLVFLLIELIRGKPINPKYEIWVNAAGMIILLGFMALVTFSDVTKLIF